MAIKYQITQLGRKSSNSKAKNYNNGQLISHLYSIIPRIKMHIDQKTLQILALVPQQQEICFREFCKQHEIDITRLTIKPALVVPRADIKTD